MLGSCLVAMALSLTLPSGVDKEWTDTALDAAFPFDGARYAGGDVHDPSVALFGDTYVMVNTSGFELAPISTSRDLMAWQHHGPIEKAQPDWLRQAIPGHRSVWAPAPVKVGKELRVYYCVSEKFGQNSSHIAYAVCPAFDPAKPTEGWIDKGVLVSSKTGESTFNAIDPDVLVGPDGRHWMVYGSYWSGLYQVELDPKTGGLKDPKAPQLHVASNTADRGNPLEAPAMFYHDGWYYLGVTYGLAAQGVRSTYRMVVGRSKSPTGPFLGWNGKPMTEGDSTSLLKTSSPMFGPGGGNFFVGKDGEWWMAYHYYDSRRFWNRDMWGAPTMQSRRVMWVDGWPLPGLPAGADLKPGDGKLAGEWTFQVDFGRVETLELKADGACHLGRIEGKWEEKDGRLLLHWPSTDAPGGAWTDTLTLDKTRQYVVGRNQAGVVVRGLKHNVQVAG